MSGTRSRKLTISRLTSTTCAQSRLATTGRRRDETAAGALTSRCTASGWSVIIDDVIGSAGLLLWAAAPRSLRRVADVRRLQADHSAAGLGEFGVCKSRACSATYCDCPRSSGFVRQLEHGSVDGFHLDLFLLLLDQGARRIVCERAKVETSGEAWWNSADATCVPEGVSRVSAASARWKHWRSYLCLFRRLFRVLRPPVSASRPYCLPPRL